LDTIRRILGYQLTIAQLIALGLIIGTPVDDAHRASSEHARGRSGGVVPRLDRVVAGAVVLERLHDMTAKAAGSTSMPRFTYLGTRSDLRGDS
jgi:hypothetical protein